MRPAREAVSKWWDNREKNREYFLWRPTTTQQRNDTWKKLFCGLCMLVSVKQITKTPNLQRFHKTANMWTVLFISLKQLPQKPMSEQTACKRRKTKKQSFSSRLPEFLIGTNSNRTERSYPFVVLPWKHKNLLTKWDYEMQIQAITSQISWQTTHLAIHICKSHLATVSTPNISPHYCFLYTYIHPACSIYHSLTIM